MKRKNNIDGVAYWLVGNKLCLDNNRFPPPNFHIHTVGNPVEGLFPFKLNKISSLIEWTNNFLLLHTHVGVINSSVECMITLEIIKLWIRNCCYMHTNDPIMVWYYFTYKVIASSNIDS